MRARTKCTLVAAVAQLLGRDKVGKERKRQSSGQAWRIPLGRGVTYVNDARRVFESMRDRRRPAGTIKLASLGEASMAMVLLVEVLRVYKR